MQKEVMTAEELAEYLSFSKNWVYRKAEAGEIPGVKLGNRWRFKKSVIDRWLEEQMKSQAEEGLDKLLSQSWKERRKEEGISAKRL